MTSAIHLLRPLPVAILLLSLGALSPSMVARQIALPAGQPMRGYSPAAAAAQRQTEERLRALPTPDSIRTWHRYLTKTPHPATSARTKEIAEYIATAWKAQGLDEVVIHRYDVLSSNPRSVSVEMVTPVRYRPSLREDPVAADPDSSQKAISGAWTSFSASGDVTAPVVYANSGNPASIRKARSSSSATRTPTATAGSRRSPRSARARRR
jgi:N-acetylated-alpha-linked acidic dipeptidase